jgi:serine/threonine-protein kinase HipA
MARRTKRLGVWLGGEHVADLEQTRWPDIRCRYTAAALERWPLNSPIISCSLPLSARPQDALAFCKGLLPEGQALQQMAAQAGVAVNETFGLLARYGRDVAGALVIGEEPPDPDRFDAIPYTDESLAEAIDELPEHPLGAHDDSELSLAGVQDKLLLVELPDDGWARPVHGRPSTHILKVEDLRFPGLIAAEAQCLNLAQVVNLTTVDVQLVQIGGDDRLIVSRFDRTSDPDGMTRRVHQEDLCQALAIDPDGKRGRAKYERAGGPSLHQAAELLDLRAADPLAELDQLVRAVTFTCLIGNADAHGKNIALLHPTPATITLAPLYDTVPTLLWPKLRKESAMMIGGRVMLTATTIADIVREAHTWGHPAARAATVADELVQQMLEAIDQQVVPRDSPVAELVRSRAERMLSDTVAG